MHRSAPVAGLLHAVGGSHQAHQLGSRSIGSRRHLARRVGGGRQPPPQLRDAGVVRGDIRDRDPTHRRASVRCDGGRHQEGALPPRQQMLGGEALAGAEPPHLAVRQRHHRVAEGIAEPVRPCQRRPQRLRRVGTVAHLRFQGEQREARGRVVLAAAVGVHERAGGLLGGELHAGGQHVEQPVEQTDLHGRQPAVTHQFATADEARLGRSRPRVAEGQAEGFVAFLEAEPIAFGRPSQRALHLAERRVRSERLPDVAAGAHAQQCQRTGPAAAAVQAVVGLVGEQGMLGAAAADRERPAAGHEQPLVVRRDHIHQERVEQVVVVDPVPLAAVLRHEPARRHRPAVGGHAGAFRRGSTLLAVMPACSWPSRRSAGRRARSPRTSARGIRDRG